MCWLCLLEFTLLAVVSILNKSIVLHLISRKSVVNNNTSQRLFYQICFRHYIDIGGTVVKRLWLCLWELWHSVINTTQHYLHCVVLITECHNSHKHSQSSLTRGIEIRAVANQNFLIWNQIKINSKWSQMKSKSYPKCIQVNQIKSILCDKSNQIFV